MALLGTAAVAMWWDIATTMRHEFEDWHSHEHFPERMSIPGFRRGSRWIDADGGEGFFILYELDRYETLASPGYLARLNAPTPWSAKMMPHHRNMVRSQCRVLSSFGGGVGQYMLTLRLSPMPGQDGSLLRKLDGIAGLPERPGLTACHLLRTETPAIAATTEQRIRGGDAVADWILLLSGYERSSLEAVAQQELSQSSLAEAGARGSILSSVFRLSYSLAATDLAATRPKAA
ncbi:MAG: hypothetical protein EOO23_05365 [Comamonadaceae bacterium]|nr:MAG: hypothetical protein EOO23_05365 [Comamonadaceae bacterium]